MGNWEQHLANIRSKKYVFLWSQVEVMKHFYWGLSQDHDLWRIPVDFVTVFFKRNPMPILLLYFPSLHSTEADPRRVFCSHQQDKEELLSQVRHLQLTTNWNALQAKNLEMFQQIPAPMILSISLLVSMQMCVGKIAQCQDRLQIDMIDQILQWLKTLL